MKTEPTNHISKKEYEKPTVRTIELVAEEVLAVGCKNVSSAAPLSIPPCSAAGCSVVDGS